VNYYFHPGAEAEYLEAIAFFESRQIGLGAAYILELEAAMVSVTYNPCSYRIKRQPNIRYASLKQFPFKIMFRDDDSGVQILAVAHKRRRPDYWLDRL
jgi:toxin ParE1/3/4